MTRRTDRNRMIYADMNNMGLNSDKTVSAVATLRARLLRQEQRDIDYHDQLQLADIQCRYRARMRHMLALYRRWQVEYAQENDVVDKIYCAYDGIFIRRQLQDAWNMYRAINRDYHEVRRHCLDRIGQMPPGRAAA